jgi:hypothetical protein
LGTPVFMLDFCKLNLFLGSLLLLLAACSSDDSVTAPKVTAADKDAISAPIAETPVNYANAARPGAARPIAARQNDTGIQFSGNHPRTLNATCQPGAIDPTDEWLMGEAFEVLTFNGQDCELGRDALAADPADGHAGFSFAKIAADGKELSADAAAWACVLDKVTGLLWESKVPADGVKGNAGLHDADDVFTWYNTDTTANGGNIGNWNQNGLDCSGYTPGTPDTFCNTQTLVSRINISNLCGYSDWRMPSLRELTGIVNYGRDQPALDTHYFRLVSGDYWSSHPAVEFPQHARLMDFRLGIAGIGMRMDFHHVLLVRGPNP